MKRKIISGIMAMMLCAGSTALAAEVHESQAQTNLVNRIRQAEMQEQPKEETIQDRVAKLLQENKVQEIQEQKVSLPKVAIMYVNNAKTTYDADVDKELFKYLNKVLTESLLCNLVSISSSSLLITSIKLISLPSLS